MAKKPFPYIPEEVLRALEEVFPDRLPRDPLTPREVVASQTGQQQVLDHLRAQLAKQQVSHRSI